MSFPIVTEFIMRTSHLFAAGCSKPTFFGIPPWYEYLQLQTDPHTGACEVVNFTLLSATGPSGLILVALALLDIALHLAGLVAVAFVIYGGIQLIMSRGEPDKAAGARSTIINALVGLAIALIAVAFVSFLGNKLG